jgi:UDP-glucose 4-epimerase
LRPAGVTTGQAGDCASVSSETSRGSAEDVRVVVTGATGNVGTSVLHSLGKEDRVSEIIGLARRPPDLVMPKTRWAEGEVSSSELTAIFRGADAVIHLAWAIQPSRDEGVLRRTNVSGSERVFRATAEAGVPALIYASSVGAYSPGPKDRRVDESWPVEGISTSFYSRHKAATERLLDQLEAEASDLRVVRMRPALIFKGEAASEIRRLFIGPFLPNFAVQRSLIPFVPRVRRLVFQAVHSHDVGEAYRQAVLRDVRGAFNLAAEPVIGPAELSALLEARAINLPAGLMRAFTDLTWRLHLQPTPPGWLDMALGVPLMDTSRAENELGWDPQRSSLEALADLLEGLRQFRGLPTPPLEPDAGGQARIDELRTGVGNEE